MDITQVLLIIALSITTILVVAVGLQLISTLKDFRRALKKTSNFIGDLEKREKKPAGKTEKTASLKKNISVHSIIDKIRILAPQNESKRKKFFIKD